MESIVTVWLLEIAFRIEAGVVTMYIYLCTFQCVPVHFSTGTVPRDQNGCRPVLVDHGHRPMCLGVVHCTDMNKVSSPTPLSPQMKV